MTKRKVTDLLPSEAILISSDAERDAVLRLFHEAGIKWANGSSTIESYPSFDYPLGLELDIDVLWNNSIYIYESIGRKILPANDFIATEAEKVEDIEQIIREVSNGFNGQSVLSDLMSIGNMKNKDGMSVVKYFDKPNGGSVAYIRHDALVKHLNELVKQLKTRNPETK